MSAPVPTDLRSQLLRDEGLRLKPYRDSVGKLTIGCGRNLDDVGIGMDEANLLLTNDIQRARAAVLARIPGSQALDEIRQAVLVNLCFNVGIAGLLKFTKFLAAVAAAQWDQAAIEMLDSRWRTQVGLRAERLADQMRSGEWR